MLIGGLVDVVTSTIFAFVYASWVIAKLGMGGAPLDQVAKALLETPIYLGYLSLGFGCSVLRGYIAARIAKHDQSVEWHALFVPLRYIRFHSNIHRE